MGSGLTQQTRGRGRDASTCFVTCKPFNRNIPRIICASSLCSRQVGVKARVRRSSSWPAARGEDGTATQVIIVIELFLQSTVLHVLKTVRGLRILPLEMDEERVDGIRLESSRFE